MPWTAKLTEVFFTGAWLAVMVKVAAPPWGTVPVEPVMVRVGTTEVVICTAALLGFPTT